MQENKKRNRNEISNLSNYENKNEFKSSLFMQFHSHARTTLHTRKQYEIHYLYTDSKCFLYIILYNEINFFFSPYVYSTRNANQSEPIS
jgi:hypothetical protein